MNTETKNIRPTDVRQFFGIVQVANSTDNALDITCDQIETKEGTKYTILIKTPKTEEKATEECLASA